MEITNIERSTNPRDSWPKHITNRGKKIELDFTYKADESLIKKETFIVDDINEVNPEGRQKQKRQLKKYFEYNEIPQHYKTDVYTIEMNGKEDCFTDTFLHEGFYIDGYKIKFQVEEILCYFVYKVDFHTSNKYMSQKLKELYEKLKTEFDVVPVITRITDPTNARYFVEGEWRIDKSRCTYYDRISYLEITKDKTPGTYQLELIDEIDNRSKDYVTRAVTKVYDEDWNVKYYPNEDFFKDER